MVSDSIARDVLIEAPPDVVWSVVTEPEMIRQWFGCSAELDLRPGGQGTFTWQQYGTTVPLVVERVERPRRFAFRWAHPQGQTPRMGNSLHVEFTLEPEGEHTRLRVVESGLNAIGWGEQEQMEYYERHSRGWDSHLANLQRFAAAQGYAASSR